MRHFCIFVQLLQNKPYLVLLVTFGSGIGLFTCLTTILEQVICPRGYSDVSIVMKILQYVSWIIKITSIKNIPDIILIFSMPPAHDLQTFGSCVLKANQ